jgi:hypothetical protein
LRDIFDAAPDAEYIHLGDYPSTFTAQSDTEILFPTPCNVSKIMTWPDTPTPTRVGARPELYQPEIKIIDSLMALTYLIEGSASEGGFTKAFGAFMFNVSAAALRSQQLVIGVVNPATSEQGRGYDTLLKAVIANAMSFIQLRGRSTDGLQLTIAISRRPNKRTVENHTLILA